MIEDTIDNVERFLDANIMIGFYQVIENCTSVSSSHLTLTQPNVYSFTCSCGTSYIGRTTRRLSDRVREYHPVWFKCLLMINSCFCFDG